MFKNKGNSENCEYCVAKTKSKGGEGMHLTNIYAVAETILVAMNKYE